MAKRAPRSRKASTKPTDNFAKTVKSLFGAQSKPLKEEGELPFGHEKFIEGVPVKAMSAKEVLSATAQDFMGNLNSWWKTGDFGTKKQEDGDQEETKNKDEAKKVLTETVKSGEKTNDILTKVLSEITLLRKITEGSLKFDKKAKGAKYRDMITGRYVTPTISAVTPQSNVSKVSSKQNTSQQQVTGRYVTPTVSAVTPQSNISKVSSKQNTSQQQVAESQPTQDTAGALGAMVPDINFNTGSKAPVPPVAGAAPSMLGRAASFMGGTGGMIAAGFGGLIGGGMFAYDKFQQADEKEGAATDAAKEKLRAGIITPQQYNQEILKAQEEKTITKGEGIGGGVGRFGGAIAGAKMGATFGSFFGPAGTVVGGVAGGALGYMAGGSIGEAAGNIGGRISNFFGGGTESSTNNIETNINKTTAGSFQTVVNGQKVEGIKTKEGDHYINGQRVSPQEYEQIKSDSLRSFNPKANATDVNSALSPTIPLNSGSSITAYSAANKDLASMQNTGSTTVINNNTSTGSNQTPSIVPLKPQVRPEASTLTRYIDSIAVY